MLTTTRPLAALVALTLALTFATTACSPAAINVAERAFLSVGVTDGGANRQLVAGTRIRLNFSGTDLGANAGCNSIGGTYRIEGGLLVFEGGAMTEMGCDQARHAQDDWLSEFLASKPSIRLAGNDMTLEGGSTIVRLLDTEVAEPDLNIVGPTWTVESIIDRDAVMSVPAGATATLVFKADGTFELDAGCNRGGGTWKLDGTGIAIAGVMLTKMACGGAGAQLEGAVLTVIGEGTIQASIDANLLTLSRDGSGLQLRG